MIADAPVLKVDEVPREKRNALMGFLLRLVKEKPLGTAGLIIVLIFVFCAIFANWVAPYGVNEFHTSQTLQGPSKTFLLGTDNLGRDTLSRIIYGARISLMTGLCAAILSLILSIVIGVLGGYLGGVFDLVTQRILEVWGAIPNLYILITMMALLGPSLWNVIFALSISWGLGGARIVRGMVYAVKQSVYIESAISIGGITSHIFIRHIIPNIVSTLIIMFTNRIPGIIMQEASLSFIGLGIGPPTPSWGNMIAGNGRSYMMQNPWMAIAPGLALALTVYGIVMFGDALRDLLDPRLRGGSGTYVLTEKVKRKLQKMASGQ